MPTSERKQVMVLESCPVTFFMLSLYLLLFVNVPVGIALFIMALIIQVTLFWTLIPGKEDREDDLNDNIDFHIVKWYKFGREMFGDDFKKFCNWKGYGSGTFEEFVKIIEKENC